MWPNLPFPIFSSTRLCWCWIYSLFYLFHTNEILQSTRLLSRYSHLKGLHSPVPPALTHVAKSHHERCVNWNELYSLCIPLARRKFYSDISFLLLLGNRILGGCFPDHCNLNIFRFRANRNLYHVPAYTFSLTFTSHTAVTFSSCSLWMVHDPVYRMKVI